jgi:Flp pilus assembly protein TadD
MSSEAQRAYERAEALEHMGRYDEAIAVLHQALASEPDDGDLLNLLSISLHGVGRFAEALSVADSALAAEPDVEGARHVRTSALWCLGRRTAALEAAREAVQAEPWCVRAWFDVAWIAGETGSLEEARAAAAEALELDPEEPDAWRAAVYAGLSEKETIAQLERGLVIAPDDPALHNDIGWGLLRHGRFAEAERFLRRAISLDPHAWIPLANLAMVLRWQGQPEEARRMRLRALDGRSRWVEERLSKDPNDVGAYLTRGIDLWDEGSHADALAEFRRVVEVEPGHYEAWAWLAFTEMTLGNMEAARAGLARALRIDPNGQMALYAKLELAYHERRPRTAASAARKLEELALGDWLSDEAGGLAALAAERYEEAIRCFNRVLERNAVRCCSYALLGIASARTGDLAGAEAAAEKRERCAPRCDCLYVLELEKAAPSRDFRQ